MHCNIALHFPCSKYFIGIFFSLHVCFLHSYVSSFNCMFISSSFSVNVFPWNTNANLNSSLSISIAFLIIWIQHKPYFALSNASWFDSSSLASFKENLIFMWWWHREKNFGLWWRLTWIKCMFDPPPIRCPQVKGMEVQIYSIGGDIIRYVKH